MAIQEVPKKYEASDGSEWKTRKEAELQEKYLEAERIYETARESLALAAASKALMGNGKPFEFQYGHYHYVTEWILQMPRIIPVNISRYNVRFQLGWHKKLQVGSQSSQDDSKWQWYDVCQLYPTEEEALDALLTAQGKYLADQAEIVEGTRQRIAEMAKGGE